MKSERASLYARVEYLRGLAEGMELQQTSKEAKLLTKVIEALGDFALEIERLDDSHRDMQQAVEGLDDALENVEEWLFDEEDDGFFDDDDDEDEDEEDDEEEPSSAYTIQPVEEGNFIEYECPHCGNKIYYDASTFSLEEDHPCPECGKSLFPEENAPEG